MDKFQGTRVWMFTGREGPNYDPYSYTVLTVRRHGVEYKFDASALRGCTIKKDGVVVYEDFEGAGADKAFAKLTGADPGQWERWYYRGYEADPMGCLSDYE